MRILNSYEFSFYETDKGEDIEEDDHCDKIIIGWVIEKFKFPSYWKSRKKKVVWIENSFLNRKIMIEERVLDGSKGVDILIRGKLGIL